MKKNCLVCGKVMDVRPSLMKRKKFCSHPCEYAYWKGKRRNPATEFKKGHMPPWFVGRRSDKHGYILIYAPNHPRAGKRRAVYEHILVWEKHNGPLPDGWVVHHINGIKHDNRIENLRAMARKNHHPALDTAVIKERVVELEKQLKEVTEKYEALLRAGGNSTRIDTIL